MARKKARLTKKGDGGEMWVRVSLPGEGGPVQLRCKRCEKVMPASDWWNHGWAGSADTCVSPQERAQQQEAA